MIEDTDTVALLIVSHRFYDMAQFMILILKSCNDNLGHAS